MSDKINEIKEVANFLFSKRITTHVDTVDGTFFNGLIIELSENFVVLNDRMLGETPILFSNISYIGRFRGNI